MLLLVQKLATAPLQLLLGYAISYKHAVLLDLQIFGNVTKFIAQQITNSQFSLLIYNFYFNMIVIVSILSWFLIIISVISA